MFLEFNSVLIDPKSRNVDLTELKSIGVSFSSWEPHSLGSSVKVLGLCMFNGWFAEFCIKNELFLLDKTSGELKPFTPLPKNINILELMMLLETSKGSPTGAALEKFVTANIKEILSPKEFEILKK